MWRSVLTVLAVGVAVGTQPGGVRAEGPMVMSGPAAAVAAPELAFPGPAVAPDEVQAAPGRSGPLARCLSPVKKCLNHCGLGCWSHHNSLGCGSLKAECVFIFGSCHAFYGEPCMQKPAPPPWAAGNGNGSGGCPSCP